MPRLKSDLLDLLYWTATGQLAGKVGRWADEAALTVVVAAKGYPGDVKRGADRGAAG